MARYEFSIIIPVLSEAGRINSIIEHIYSRGFSEGFEIIVVDGSPDGETINAISRKEVKITVSEKGRAAQMNAGAAIASGEILIFLHADTRLPGNALQKIRAVMEQKRYVAGAFDLGIDSARLAFRIISFGANLRSHLNRIPYGDQAIFVRKDHFHSIGGYRKIPLMEDVELMRRLKKRGDKICILPDRVRTSPRRWEKEGIICCTLRNWVISTLYFMGVSPHKLIRYYRSDRNGRKNR